MNNLLSAGLLGFMPGLAQGGLLSQQPQQQPNNFTQMAAPYATFAEQQLQQSPQQSGNFDQMAAPYASWAAAQLQKVSPTPVQQPQQQPDQQALFDQMLARYQQAGASLPSSWA